MGAFDTFYHHELTERLAWRPSQRYELKLHGVRNLLYALLFLVLGWLEVYGVLAMIVIAVLVAEIVITLMDFVEEDLSRKLPASERINHTLLAINYGAILVLLLPLLIEWAVQPTGIEPAYAGLLSIVATAARRWRGPVRRARFRGGKAARPHDQPAGAANSSQKLPGRTDDPRHRRHRLHRQPAGRSARRSRPSGHRAGSQSRQGRDAAAADHR